MQSQKLAQHHSLSALSLSDLIADSAQVIHGKASDYDQLLRQIGDARFVLIGEASHGTHEFYAERARITQRLIEEKGFNAIAIEADWPVADRVNRYVRRSQLNSETELDQCAADALEALEMFPSWLWANVDVALFVEWLRQHNDEVEENEDENSRHQAKVGFYGLDTYRLFRSMDLALNYLDEVDQESAELARKRYACFDQFHRDSQRYGYTIGLDLSHEQEKEIQQRLKNFLVARSLHTPNHQQVRPETAFHFAQKSTTSADADQYCRSIFRGDQSTWNLRDSNMAHRLSALADQLSKCHGKPAKIVVWAHNSHAGDARATEIGRLGELSLGQLMRERYSEHCFLIGMTSHHGSVTASSDWGSPAEYKYLRPSLEESYEEAMHLTSIPSFVLPLKSNDALNYAMSKSRLARNIGVSYRPSTERQSHYTYVNLAQQFDAIIHIDKSRAVKPLDEFNIFVNSETPISYPIGV